VKNSVYELERILKIPSKVRMGVVLSSIAEGGFVVQTIEGGEETVFGTAAIGDSVLYENGIIITKQKKETAKVYHIK